MLYMIVILHSHYTDIQYYRNCSVYEHTQCVWNMILNRKKA